MLLNEGVRFLIGHAYDAGAMSARRDGLALRDLQVIRDAVVDTNSAGITALQFEERQAFASMIMNSVKYAAIEDVSDRYKRIETEEDALEAFREGQALYVDNGVPEPTEPLWPPGLFDNDFPGPEPSDGYATEEDQVDGEEVPLHRTVDVETNPEVI